MRETARREAYEVYVSDCLKLVAGNTARAHGGSVMQARWYDLINKPRSDGRTGGEIAADVIARAGLEVR